MSKAKKNKSIVERGSITKRVTHLEQEVESLKRRIATVDIPPLDDEDVPPEVLYAIEESREEYRAGKARPFSELLAELDADQASKPRKA